MLRTNMSKSRGRGPRSCERSDVLDPADDAGVEVYFVSETPSVMAQLRRSWHTASRILMSRTCATATRRWERKATKSIAQRARHVWEAHGFRV